MCCQHCGKRRLKLITPAPARLQFFWEFWSAGIFKVLSDAAQVTSPLVMRVIIRQTQKAWAAKQAGAPLPPVGTAIGAAIGLFFMQVWVSYFQANTFSRSGQVGIQARATLIASLCGLSRYPANELANLCMPSYRPQSFPNERQGAVYLDQRQAHVTHFDFHLPHRLGVDVLSFQLDYHHTAH